MIKFCEEVFIWGIALDFRICLVVYIIVSLVDLAGSLVNIVEIVPVDRFYYTILLVAVPAMRDNLGPYNSSFLL